MGLHALVYCERLFYLEEVEEIRVADNRVYAGRTLHDAEVHDDGASLTSVTLESASWGIKGKVDYLRYRDGHLVPYEHKRGRSKGGEAWESDRIQALAYSALLQEHLGHPIPEARVRYHASNKTVRVRVDEPALEDLRQTIARARALSESIDRPPVSANENLCARCSLAPVCLPEEERFEADAEGSATPIQRLFPALDERRIVHVTDPGSRVGKQGDQIVVTPRDAEPHRFPGHDVSAIVLHGAAQISSQAIHFCVAHRIAVHWLTGGGRYAAGLQPAGGVQRRHRQYRSLTHPDVPLRLARRLARTKVSNQRNFLLRSGRSRGLGGQLTDVERAMRAELRGIDAAKTQEALRGHEGMAGRLYFSALPQLIEPGQHHMHFSGRSRRPPTDPFNAALSFGYSLLYRDVMSAIISVGLDPAFGFFHRPRSAAYPLALDLMELFRTPLWDISLVGSINRRQWNPEHFVTAGRQVWLSDTGRRLAISLYEKRKQESWRHPVVGYSLSYGRAIELEVRLLEKEWSGAPGLFGRMSFRA
jgi:CRISPR-associated protein Cas1